MTCLRTQEYCLYIHLDIDINRIFIYAITCQMGISYSKHSNKIKNKYCLVFLLTRKSDSAISVGPCRISPPHPRGGFLKELRNFFCSKTRFQGLRPFWVVIVVVRHIVYCERFGSFRADVSCFANNICLNSTVQTDRCGRICLFNLTVAEFECKYRVFECILVVVRHILYSVRFSGYRADVSFFCE